MSSHVLPVDEQQLKDILWAFVVRSLDHVVLIMDDDGRITWCNRGALGTLCAEATGLVGRHLSEIFLLSDVEIGIPQHEMNEARSKQSSIDDRWLRRMDGTRFWASGVTVHLAGMGDGCSFIKIFRDMTDAKMQMEGARESCRAAKQESEGKSFAIAVLAHELRNPLSGVSLAAEILHMRTDGDDRVTKPLAAIEQNIVMASRLIEDLLQHSKVESNGFILDRERCDLRELLVECVHIASKQAERDTQVEPLLLPRGRLFANIDRNRMKQVFVNLIANSLRYTDVPGRIWISGTREGTELVVRITDEGAGIAPEKLEHLFHVFTLPGLESSRLGLGLGLMVVKKIVEAHGGTVQVRSDGAGHGSQFTVRFPAGTSVTASPPPALRAE